MSGNRFDLVVVGAGPAGAAAALAARRVAPWAEVLLLDRHDFPRDKPCGDAIAWHALQELAHLGVGDLLDDHAPSTTITIRAPRGATWTAPLPRAGKVVPRRRFDARLVAAAERAGVQRHVHRVRRLQVRNGGVAVDDVALTRGVVGADGSSSTVRRLLGLGANAGRHRAVAIRGYRAVDPGDTSQLIELTDEAGWPAYRWRFGVGDGTANVGFGLLDPALVGGADQLHAGLGPLGAGGPTGDLRAAPMALSTHRPRLGRGRVLLAGDAAALVNPLSGEGIHQALLSGRLAAEALLGPGPALRAYRVALRALLARQWRATSIAARMLTSPRLVDGGVRALRSDGHGPAVVDLAIGRGGLPGHLAVRIALTAAVAAARPTAGAR